MSFFIIQLQAQSIGIFDGHNDIGNPKLLGSVQYDQESQIYRISGAGSNMWSSEDQFHYLWKQMQGDFILRCKLQFLGEGVNAHRKIGWIVRDNFHTSSPHVNASIHGDGLTNLQFRKTKGGETEEIQTGVEMPDILQLERKDGKYLMSVAHDGEEFTTVELDSVGLRNEVFVGLYVCSHDSNVVEQAVFSNVRIVKPAPEDFRPYRDYIGSNLEIMDIESGNRKIVFRSTHSLQAPNWMHDGNTLIYNSNGVLYNFDIPTGNISMLNTGFVTRNNNDHVISFDGKMLGISSQLPEDNNSSTIYTLPIEGSDNPKRISQGGHSYLHSWSPDGKYLIFTGQRNGKYDIWRIAVENSQETPITDTPGLDDGSEYGPEGKYIYFNSNRTGTMEVWRVDADGNNPKQMTDDEHQNWFPHVSPDNKWIVFIAFPAEIGNTDHPFYKRCMLKLMPVEGGETKVIAFIYGGQGTINTPSWSPDSKKIAFVSNSQME